MDAASMREEERKAEEAGYSRLLMMENAGRAVADAVLEVYDGAFEPRVLAVCGTGNNGGDCVAAARHLSPVARVDAILLGDEAKTEEARYQWSVARKAGGLTVHRAADAASVRRLGRLFSSADVILDGVLGTGIGGRVRDPAATAIRLTNDSAALVVALDVPSGLDPDTGRDSGVVVRAGITVTFHAPKPGLAARRDACGKVLVRGIGLPRSWT
ncbi:MAG: NAD(P)H-hydrate epimerase [Nitrososphaerota archaeon]|nr:NAD(P)H-hydrate epimerase [Nitrososphaerota archaeon]